MAIEIVDFPMKNGGSFHSYVELPEGNDSDKQRVVINWLMINRDLVIMIVMIVINGFTLFQTWSFSTLRTVFFFTRGYLAARIIPLTQWEIPASNLISGGWQWWDNPDVFTICLWHSQFAMERSTHFIAFGKPSMSMNGPSKNHGYVSHNQRVTISLWQSVHETTGMMPKYPASSYAIQQRRLWREKNAHLYVARGHYAMMC